MMSIIYICLSWECLIEDVKLVRIGLAVYIMKLILLALTFVADVRSLGTES